MPTEVRLHAVHAGGMKMIVGDGRHEVIADYPLQPGVEAAGLKPMELLLASLATCAGSVVALLLERSKQPVTRLAVDVRGARRDEHPTVFTEISLEFAIRGVGPGPGAFDVAGWVLNACLRIASMSSASPIPIPLLQLLGDAGSHGVSQGFVLECRWKGSRDVFTWPGFSFAAWRARSSLPSKRRPEPLKEGAACLRFQGSWAGPW